MYIIENVGSIHVSGHFFFWFFVFYGGLLYANIFTVSVRSFFFLVFTKYALPDVLLQWQQNGLVTVLVIEWLNLFIFFFFLGNIRIKYEKVKIVGS